MSDKQYPIGDYDPKIGWHRPKKNTHQTFLTRIKISENGCWEWQHSKDTRGYGRININGTYWRSHRYSYHYYKGDIGQMNVLHKCDNPQCCNPDHLFLGNVYENAIDMLKKGRGGKTKLTVENVFEIRELAALEIPRIVISEYLGIKRRTVDNVINGKRWGHLTFENKDFYKTKIIS